MPRFDPQAVIEQATVPSDGWRLGRVVLRHGPRRPFEGLISPDGTAWECFDAPTRISELRNFARRVREQQAAGYTQAIVTVDGRRFLAEHFRDSIKPWDGLDLVGEWHDDSCSGDPWQHWTEATFRGGRVALYIRWRHHDPWTGNVVRLAPGDDPRWLYRYPWSPNLLPTDPPIVNEQPVGLLVRLSLDTPPHDPWITEDDVRRAKREIQTRADTWLCDHVDDSAAWTNVTQVASTQKEH